MESSLEWLRNTSANLKKVYDEILNNGYGLPAIRSILGDFTNPDETIAHKLENLDIDTTDLAKEDTLTRGIESIQDAVEGLYGGDPNATLSAIKDAIENIVLDTTDLAKADALQDVQDDINDIEDLIGTSTDVYTDSTIFGKLAAVLLAISNIVIDTSDLAKEDTLLQCKDEIIQETQKSILQPFVRVDGGDVIFSFVTVQQMEKMIIEVTDDQDYSITFNLTADNDTFYLKFSDECPAAIAGDEILSDSTSMLYYVWNNLSVSFPSTYVINSVSIDGTDGNLLEADASWRLADIQREVFGLTTLLDEINGESMPVEFAMDYARQNTLLQVQADVAAISPDAAQGKAAIVEAIHNKGGEASTNMSLSQLAGAVDDLSVPTLLRLSNTNNSSIFENSIDNPVIDMSSIGTWFTQRISFNGYGSLQKVKNIPYTPNLQDLGSAFANCTSLTELEIGSRIDTSNLTSCPNMFMNCTSLEKVDISMLDTSHLTSNVSNMFSNCPTLTEVDMRNLHFVGYCYNVFYSGTTNVKTINAIDTDASGATQFGDVFSSLSKLETLVGDKTYQEVVDEDIKVFNNLHINFNTNFNSSPLINRASLRALINGLADRTDQSTLTLTIGATNLAKLSADDIAVATNKNWTLA